MGFPVTHLPSVFSSDEIGHILRYGLFHFKHLENTSANLKLMDDRFSLFTEIIEPAITESLPREFKIKGGFLNKSSVPYILHTDGARFVDEKVICTVLLPLEIESECAGSIQLSAGRLYVFDQRCSLATLLRMGRNPISAFSYRDASSKQHYEEMLIGSTGQEFSDEEVLSDCSHLRQEEFFGLSLKAKLPWTIGDCILFDPHHVHASTNFKDLGIRSKTNLVYSLIVP